MYGTDRDLNIDFYLRDIAFYDGACYSCITHCQKGTLNCTTDYDQIIREVYFKRYTNINYVTAEARLL